MTLTVRQKEIMDKIVQFYRDHGFMPTIRDISQLMGIDSHQGITQHLLALEKKGYLSREFAISRGMRFSERACNEYQIDLDQFSIPDGKVTCRHDVTPKQVLFIKTFDRLHKTMKIRPSYREMMEEMKFKSLNAIRNYFQAMVKKGLMVQEEKATCRSYRITNLGMDYLEGRRGFQET